MGLSKRERRLRKHRRRNMRSNFIFGCFKAAVAMVIMAVAFTPTWIWLVIYNLVDPTTWWARLLTVGAGFFFLGLIQMFCAVVGFLLAMAAVTR